MISRHQSVQKLKTDSGSEWLSAHKVRSSDSDENSVLVMRGVIFSSSSFDKLNILVAK